jgi:hypothetical protein
MIALKTYLQFVAVGVIALGLVADQWNPWNNTLEAVLFTTSETDFDQSGETNVVDLLFVISDWGTCTDCVTDIDGNGIVDVTDLLAVIEAWGPNEVILLETTNIEHAGVPCFSYGPDGELVQMFQYFPNEDETLDFIARRVSYDDGQTWGSIEGIMWSGGPTEHSVQADPSIVLLSDGTWRLYFTCDIDAQGPEFPATYSAVSEDGLQFTWEDWKSPRMYLENLGLLDPSVIYFNEMYHFFAPVPGEWGGSVHAVSKDGYSFTVLDDIEIKNHENAKFLGNPAIVNDKLYFFGTVEPVKGAWGGIFIAESEDALNWSVIYEELADVADPAGIQTPEGLLLFKTTLLD